MVANSQKLKTNIFANLIENEQKGVSKTFLYQTNGKLYLENKSGLETIYPKYGGQNV